ncbi:porin family protein [Bradyrhizobium prioriisuperbiae]|uniref:outer membrane protein n=1 Tax=Bradyrhizobium prioriisuperbiae TaxID=2854389 RepID=UPI0028E4E9B9|nr:porin family protein [Bradyrhizobium prioritasuperba]
MKKVLLTTAFAFAGIVSASAADLAARPYTKAPPVIAEPIYNWTGFYIGGNVGYGWGNADTQVTPLPTAAQFINLAPTTLSPDPKGVIGGGQIGFNWQVNRFVWGLEADIQGADIKGTALLSPIIQNNGTPFGAGSSLQSTEKLTWFGTVRGRLGFSPIDRLLLYATGGLAYGHVDYSAITDFRPTGTASYPAAFGKTKVGWTAGAGAEWAFTQNWSAKLEYLYLDLGSQSAIANPTIALPPFQVGYDWKTQEHIVRAGINYKFGGPVVAKY